MEDELLNEEEAKVYREDEGYSVEKTGLISNLESRTEKVQKKSDAEVNIHMATALTMDVKGAEVVKNAELILKVTATPFIASCPKLTWLSSNEKVAVVDDQVRGSGVKEDGVVQVYARGIGEATITAKAENGLSCSMELTVVEEESEEEGPIEVGSKYAFTSYSDDEEATEYASGTVEVLSSTTKLAKIKVLTNEPDDPENTWVGREFYVDVDAEVGEEKYHLYTNTKKTVVPGIVVKITSKIEEEAGE